MYIYESHDGGLYMKDREIAPKDLMCETCGGCDFLLGEANNKEQAKDMLYETYIKDIYGKKWIDEWAEGAFE